MLQAYSVKLPGDTLSPFVLLAYADNFPAPEIRKFHLVVAQRRKGTAQKSVTYEQSFFLFC